MAVTQQSSPYLDSNPNGVSGGFSQQYGYFQARIMMTPGSGFWNAFWLLPNQGAWPPEIDIVEASNNMASFTNHGGDINTPVQSTAIYNRPDLSQSFQTYGLMWTPTALTWFLDGQAIFSAPTAGNENVPMNIILSAHDQGGPLSGCT